MDGGTVGRQVPCVWSVRDHEGPLPLRKADCLPFLHCGTGPSCPHGKSCTAWMISACEFITKWVHCTMALAQGWPAMSSTLASLRGLQGDAPRGPTPDRGWPAVAACKVRASSPRPPSRCRGRRRGKRCARPGWFMQHRAGGQVQVEVERFGVGRCTAPAWFHAGRRSRAPCRRRQRLLGDLGRRNVTVAGRHHLGFGRQVHHSWKPSITPSSCSGISGGSGPSPRSSTARRPGPAGLVAGAVAVAHAAVQHVGHGLEASVRMRGPAM